MSTPDQLTLGWREWASLPDLGIDRIKVKVDTGARTSALHAFSVEPFTQDGQEWVRFLLHPKQQNTTIIKKCTAKVLTRKKVSDSGGHSEERYFIETTMCIGDVSFPAQLTLTNRDTMRFRMLLGRKAMEGRFVVDPSLSYCLGKPIDVFPDASESENGDL